MKKYLMLAVAGLAIASCSKMDDYATSPAEIVQAKYNQAFYNYVEGKIDPNQTWGFSDDAYTRSGADITRSISVNGDAYDKFPSADDVAANFPTAIPEGAVEVSQLEALYKGTKVQTQYGETTLWDLYAIYSNVITEGFNLKITQAGTTELGGSYQNAGYDATAGKNVARPYNVYVNVDGDVTLKRNGSTHFNLYILKGNVTLESNYGEQAGLISVAAGATLNDQRNSVAANQGVKIFNRGTINATNTQKYDIGNFCTVYNEGKFNVTGALTYSPGDANTSYFMNLGDDAELTASAMTLNSAGNFYNDGKVVINGETNVTQKDIYWVNAGYYKTGSIVFSAKNATFYNYCQLIVTGNAHMYDGEFNLMPNSYTEVATAEMDNFIVNMGGNAGINIKGAVRVKAQGDGTFQGFKNFGTNNYVLIGGKVTVDSHKKTFSVESGITYSIKEIEIVRGGSVVTEAQLQEEKSGDYPVLDLQGTEAPFGKLTVTPKEFGQGCGATWTTDTTPPTPTPSVNPNTIRIIAEDLSAAGGTDFDFNDVVLDVTFGNPAKVVLTHAGGTLPLRINGNDAWEVHKLFGVWKEDPADLNKQEMVNTNRGPSKPSVDLTNELNVSISSRSEADTKLKLEVYKEGSWIEMTSPKGEPACKLAVGQDFKVLDERQSIKKEYPDFLSWVRGENFSSQWW